MSSTMVSKRRQGITNILQALESYQIGLNCKKALKRIAEFKVATNACYNTRYEVRAKSTFLVAFSPDRSTVASSHGDHTIKVFSMKTGKLIKSLTGYTRTAWCLDYHPSLSNILASGSLAGEIRVWDLNTGDCQCFNITGGNVISSLSFPGDDDTVVAASSNKLYFLNWRTGEVITTLTTGSTQESIRIVRFIFSSAWMLTGILNDPDEKEQSIGDVEIQRNPAFGRNTIQTVSCHRIEDRSATATVTATNSVITATAPTSCSVIDVQNTRGGFPYESSRGPVLSRIDSERSHRNRFSMSVNLSRSGDRSSSARRFSRIDEEPTPDDDTRDRQQTELVDANGNSLHQGLGPVVSTLSSAASPEQNVAQTVGMSLRGDNNTDHQDAQNVATSVSSSMVDTGTPSHLYRIPSHDHDSSPSLSLRRSTYGSNRYSPEYARSSRRNTSGGYERGDVRRRRRRDGVGTARRAPRVWTALNSFDRPFRSEIWNVDLGQGGAEVFASQVTIASTSSSQSMGDFTSRSRSAIPVYSFISYPSESRYTSSISGVEPDAHAIATATARTPRHVHTAVVIAGGNENESDTALRTAINRAIAGAFAGNGEGAVAANIVNTSYRLQLWDFNDDLLPDLRQSKKNVIVPHCKLHNDGSIDVSQDGTLLATYVPSTQGFPDNGQICVFSLRNESLGQCIYSRSYGPNLVCVSFSPLNNYLLVGLASRTVIVSTGSEELMGQILKLPGEGEPIKLDDTDQVILNVVHPKKGQHGLSVSVNTAKFHPTPGVGVIYGTNHGTVRHCRIGKKISKKKLAFINET